MKWITRTSVKAFIGDCFIYASSNGMSADNLYRTFPSKEATVEGLCPRDQQERIASFVHLADSDSVFVAIAAGLRAHIELRSRQKPTLIVEIWAEAQRNPAIAAMSRAVDAVVRKGRAGKRPLRRPHHLHCMKLCHGPSKRSRNCSRFVRPSMNGWRQSPERGDWTPTSDRCR